MLLLLLYIITVHHIECILITVTCYTCIFRNQRVQHETVLCKYILTLKPPITYQGVLTSPVCFCSAITVYCDVVFGRPGVLLRQWDEIIIALALH